MPYKDPEKRREAARRATAKWMAANPEKVKAARAAYHASPEGKAVTAAYHASPEVRARDRALDMARRPERFRKAYDPNCRPFPARYDPSLGQWVRCKQITIPAPDKSPATHLATALIVIDERLNFPD
jgi:hypothetical protein